MKKKPVLFSFRAFPKSGASRELHVVADTQEKATTIAESQLGKCFVFKQMNTDFTQMLISKRKVGFMDTTTISDKNIHHDTHLSEGRKLVFVSVN